MDTSCLWPSNQKGHRCPGWAARCWLCLLFAPSVEPLIDPAFLPLAVTSAGLAGAGLSCLLDSWNSLKLRAALALLALTVLLMTVQMVPFTQASYFLRVV